jgi:hypothetical protein
MASKIYTDLVGGVGNQLFIYSAGYYLSMQREVEFRPRILKPAFGDTMHSSSINDLTIFPKIKVISICRSKYIRIVTRIRRVILQHFPGLDVVLKSGKYISEVIGYDEKFESTDASRVEGYFQTYKYVEKILETKPSFIKFEAESPSDWYLKMTEELDFDQTVGIHIRGGDYLNDVNREIGNLSSQYYERAIKMSMEISDLKDIKFFIFTDDLDYAQALMGSVNLSMNMKFVVPPSESKPTESMLLMSRAKIRIISNSTFAWWAGYLGYKKGFVIAPSKWFKEKDDPSCLIPKNWKVCESIWTMEKLTDKVGRLWT